MDVLPWTIGAVSWRPGITGIVKKAPVGFYLTDNNGCSIHAEVATYYKVRKMTRRTTRVTLFVVRHKETGLSMSKPCLKCQKFLMDKNVRVFYTDCDGQIRKYI